MAGPLYPVVFFDLGDTLVSKPPPGSPPGSRLVWIDSALEILKALRAQGVRLGVISNTPGLQRAQLATQLPVDFDFGLFEAKLVLLSSEQDDILKPDPRLFKRAVAAAGVPERQCLFCGESLLETIAAQRTGMSAARLQPPTPQPAGHLPTSDLKELVRTLGQVLAIDSIRQQ